MIGADGIGTAFGNSGTGIVDGPGQANLDLALAKNLALRWPEDSGSLRVRAEFYNASIIPSFQIPILIFTSLAFGSSAALR